MCIQTMVQPHWIAEFTMTILNKEMLLDVLNKFQVIDPNQSTLNR